MTGASEHTFETMASLERQLAACREELKRFKIGMSDAVHAVQQEKKAVEADRDRLREVCDWMIEETRGNISTEFAHALCMQFRTRMKALEPTT